MAGDEVFQNCQSFAEVCYDRTLDDLARRLGHQSAHSRQLPDLVFASTCPGIEHRIDRIDFRAPFILMQNLLKLLSKGLVRVGPHVDTHVVALHLGDEALFTLLSDFLYILLRPPDNVLLVVRHNHVLYADGEPCPCRIFISKILEFVKNLNEFLPVSILIAGLDHRAKLLLAYLAVEEPHLLRPYLAEDTASASRDDELVVLAFAVPYRILSIEWVAEVEEIVHLNRAGFLGQQHLLNAVVVLLVLVFKRLEILAPALVLVGEIIDA